MRASDATKVLWVDALCINQHTADEKARQVWTMHDIYADARVVIIWLQDGWDGADLVFGLLHTLADDEALNLYPERAEHPAVSELALLSPATFLALPWFRRLSTIQELSLPDAAAVIFRCGELRLAGTLMFRAWDNLWAHAVACCWDAVRWVESESQPTTDQSGS